MKGILGKYMKKIIINADDFGHSKDVNLAISSAFRLGLISSSTLIANMAGFDDAINIIYKNDLNGKVGIHFNLSEGKPLSKNILRCSRIVDKWGNLDFQRNSILMLTKEEKKAIFDELEMQLLKLIRCGITPTHIDSHHHIHTEWSIGSQVVKLAHKYNIYSIRLSRNTGVGISLEKKIYKFIFNKRLCFHGFRITDYFGDYRDLMSKKMNKNVELMVHPLIVKNELVDLDRTNLKNVIEKILSLYNDHSLSSY